MIRYLKDVDWKSVALNAVFYAFTGEAAYVSWDFLRMNAETHFRKMWS